MAAPVRAQDPNALPRRSHQHGGLALIAFSGGLLPDAVEEYRRRLDATSDHGQVQVIGQRDGRSNVLLAEAPGALIVVGRTRAIRTAFLAGRLNGAVTEVAFTPRAGGPAVRRQPEQPFLVMVGDALALRLDL